MLKIIRFVMKTMIVMSVLLFSTVSIAEPDWQVLPDKINKSERNTRQYQAIKLSNEMIVLLESDPEAVESFASVSLPIGSMCDPNQQLGLAHYLEHMIFHGSKRYPVSRPIVEFVGKNGGSHNGMTGFHSTDFYLKVKNGALKAATDRLADALAEPLLDPIKADQERNIINSEATMYRSNDMFRRYQVRSETLNSVHPSSRFKIGNLETLSDKPDSNLHSELKKFHHRYYSANLMKGFLYGKESLSQLAKIAAETFGRIPNRKASVPAITVPAITDKEKGIIVHYVPFQPNKNLSLEFRIANNLTEFRSKTDQYISYLIRHQSHNTLADWLLNNRFAEGIHAYTMPAIDGNSGMFVIGMELTDKGLEHRDKIIAAVFSYINLLKKGGIKSSYFNEMARNMYNLYQNYSIVRGMSSGLLSNEMLYLPIANVLDADYIADRFNPQAISARLSELTPRNARIWFTSPNEPHNKEAYHLNAPYQVDKINPQQYEKWADLQKTIKFSLPELNPYIANDFSLIKSSRHYQHPELVYNQGNCQVFYMPSQHFADEPQGEIFLNLRSEQSNKTAKSQISSWLLQYLAWLKISQLNYQASVAGMYINLSSNLGLQFRTSGYTQHLPELMIKVIKEYLAFTISEEEVAQAKSRYREQCEVSDNHQAGSLALYPLSLEQVPFFERDQLLKELETITANDILKYRKDTIENAPLRAMVFGNLTPKQGIDTIKSVCNLLNNKGKKWGKKDIVVIDKEYKVNFENQANNTDNALAEIFIPIGYDKNKGFVLSSILAQILHGWFVEQLRTQEKLGYSLYASETILGKQWGIKFVLQSNNKTPAYLHTRYQNFYQLAFKKLKAMPKKEFEQYRKILLTELEQPPQSFYQEINRFMYALRQDDVHFDDRKEKTINALKTVTQQDLLTFYSNAVLQKKGLALVSQVIAKGVNKDGYVQLKDWITYPTISELQKIFPRKEK
ncbi:MAG: pitrilysin [Candidatus Liberibacter europaeus]|uniref:Protease 3 n=1 Tax=Candidatus Liberibacter europaeus TaxID=744859 RepID=A0A2T4VYP2_9HYPH|nr:MAG: pitrilysin [Candidatus Liberibacter europaeus]